MNSSHNDRLNNFVIESAAVPTVLSWNRVIKRVCRGCGVNRRVSWSRWIRRSTWDFRELDYHWLMISSAERLLTWPSAGRQIIISSNLI